MTRGGTIRSAVTSLFLLAGPSGLAQESWEFRDVTAESGLELTIVSGTPQKKYLVSTMTGGVCVIDSDGDDWPDLYFVNGTTREHWNKGTGPSNRLYRNLGNGTFRDVTERAGLRESGWGMGCAAADYDNDGDTDLYVTNFGRNALYRNQGNGTFQDVAKHAGVDDPLWGTGAAFGDYDKDGDLDLYLANYVDFDFDKPAGDARFCNYRGVKVACGPRGLPGAPDRLFRNEGNGRFIDVTAASGIGAAAALYGFQAVWTDADGDGDPDIFVANDSTPNFLWENLGDGRFQDVALFAGVAYNERGREQACMGVAVGDIDGDGDFDLYSTNFSDDYHVLYRNEGSLFFKDATFKARIAQATFKALGFGAFIEDLNNDGLSDVFAANGHIYPEVDTYNLGSTYKQLNQLFRNQGGGSFAEVGPDLGPGLSIVKSSRGAALIDFDKDGDLDIVVSNLDDRIDLLRNDLGGGAAFLQVKLRGRTSNRDGIGARVELWTGSTRQVRELRSGASYLSDSEKLLHFGLGSAARADRLEILWPSGRRQSFTNISANTRILVDEAKGLAK